MKLIAFKEIYFNSYLKMAMKCSFYFCEVLGVKCCLLEDKPFHLAKKVNQSVAEM